MVWGSKSTASTPLTIIKQSCLMKEEYAGATDAYWGILGKSLLGKVKEKRSKNGRFL